MLDIQLSNIHSLKELDLSFNSLQGIINPSNLPPNVTNINLAFNQFSQSIPFSLVSLKYLSYLNLSHNSFFGPLGNIFTGLTNMKYLDLSYNSFTGDLPSSFCSMTNLTVLYLQNNQFIGSVNFLSNLPLCELALMTPRNYTFADLQLYTNNFSKENLLGEGSIGSVYKGCFSKGQDFVVKNINMVELPVPEECQFQLVVVTMSCLRHTNIVSLLGYCKEHGQCLLLYEYVGKHTLKDYLHYIEDPGPPLSWIARLNIGLGVARALEYLHWTCSPPIPHCNIKSGNVMLNNEGLPILCDCGLALLITAKDKSSQPVIGSTIYTAPEHGKPGIDKTKSDVYEFGVLMLELLTGKQPFDRDREEKYLVAWASSRLHDILSLDDMVDPRIRGSYSFHHLSLLAKIITLCIKWDPELRPSISEVAESLAYLVEDKISICKAEDQIVEEAAFHE